MECGAAINQFLVVAADRATFAGWQVLGVLKTEAAQIGERAAFLPLVLRQPSLARIFDNAKIVLPGNGVDGIHVTRHAEDVNRQDQLRAIRDSTLDRGRIHRQCGGIRVGEDRQSLVDQNCVIGRNERVGGHNHFITRVQADCMKCRDQGGRSTGRGEAAPGRRAAWRSPPRILRYCRRHCPGTSVRFAGSRESSVPTIAATPAILAKRRCGRAFPPRGQACRSRLLSASWTSDPPGAPSRRPPCLRNVVESGRHSWLCFLLWTREQNHANTNTNWNETWPFSPFCWSVPQFRERVRRAEAPPRFRATDTRAIDPAANQPDHPAAQLSPSHTIPQFDQFEIECLDRRFLRNQRPLGSFEDASHRPGAGLTTTRCATTSRDSFFAP